MNKESCYKYFIAFAAAICICILLYKKYSFNMRFLRYTFLVVLLMIVAFIDIKKRIIPDKFIIIGILGGVIFNLLDFQITIFDSILGLLFSGGIFGLIGVISKGAVGMGDVKLLACIGILLGIKKVLSTIFISLILCGVTGIIMIIINFKNRKKSIPFAPYILIGTLIELL